VVVLRPGATATEADLLEHCRGQLAGFESPKAVVFTDALPETVGGKVLKFKLREAHAGLFASS
jgi:acyl-CoA synthetase (AMP-forming)/AMP-acid ligase II